MDKMRLHELCQKRRWGLPEYKHSWTGTGHVPHFTASVTVNGSVFQSPDAESRSVKEAQNKAAAVAFETLSATPIINAVPSPPPSPAVVSISSQPSKSDLIVATTDKAKLQELCQKRRWVLPRYTHSTVGSVREPRFVASVTVNGSVFECPDAVSRSIKEAQNKAAAVAFEALFAARAADAAPSPSPSLVVQSLPPPQPHAALLVGTTYKVRLQELCQKRRWELPQYTHSKVGSVREPRFIASVSINGSVFESPDAESRSIKEAQNKAAAVAFETLFAAPGTNVVPSQPPPPSVESISAQPSQMGRQSQVSSSSSASPPMNGTQNSCSSTMESKPPVPHVSLSLPTSIPKCDEVMSENQAGDQQLVAHESIIETAQESELPNDLTSKLTENQMPVAQESKLTENQMSVTAESKPLPANPTSELFVTTNSICSEGPVLAATKDGDNKGIDPFLMLNRIQVYPRCPGSAVPNGAMPLPFSDESWTAVSLDYFQ